MQRIGSDPWWSHTVLQLLQHLPPASEALVQAPPRVLPSSLTFTQHMVWHASRVWRTPGVGKSAAP